MIGKIDGNKTYIVGGLTVVWGILGLLLGQMETEQAIPVILAGLGVFGFRSAISKVR